MGTSRTGAAGAASRIHVSRTGRSAPAPRTGRQTPLSVLPPSLPLNEILLGDCIANLEKLPPETAVHPGHMGLTTLGAERAGNPFLAELAR